MATALFSSDHNGKLVTARVMVQFIVPVISAADCTEKFKTLFQCGLNIVGNGDETTEMPREY